MFEEAKLTVENGLISRQKSVFSLSFLQMGREAVGSVPYSSAATYDVRTGNSMSDDGSVRKDIGGDVICPERCKQAEDDGRAWAAREKTPIMATGKGRT